MKSIVIQLICPDQKGIIAQLTSILNDAGNNILSIEQYVDKQNEKFYIRILTEIKEVNRNNYAKLGLLSKQLNGTLAVFNANRKRNIAIIGAFIIINNKMKTALIKHAITSLIFAFFMWHAFIKINIYLGKHYYTANQELTSMQKIIRNYAQKMGKY